MVLLDHGGCARGEIRFTPAAPDLAALVEHVWVQSTAAQVRDWRVVPDASRVRHAAATLLMSERTLRDRVRRAIGLSPKKALRIVRLHRALHLARRHAASSWADLAQMSEYADQPHFVRECQDLLGESPSAWVARGSADSFKTARASRL